MPAALRLIVAKTEPLLRGQEHFWKVARKLGEADRPFTAAELRELTEEPHDSTVTTFLRRLWKGGYLVRGKVRHLKGRKKEQEWHLHGAAPGELPRLADDGSRLSPVTAQGAMWNVMRGPAGRAGFTWRDLVAWGSTELLEIKANTAKSYIALLQRAGYLLLLDPGHPGTPATWKLRPAMNTGPKPPMILAAKLVYDQNRGKVTGPVIAVQPGEVEP